MKRRKVKNTDKIEAEKKYYSYGTNQPVKCLEFGCGKELTRQEKLFGNKCMDHSNAKIKTVNSKRTENLFTPDCIRTVTGHYVNVFDPDPATICIEDIAHALSHQCRFGGHLPQFYSVAQHSIFCADLASDDHKLAALMHDASEAYLLDIPRPVKLKLSNYKEIEDGLMKLIAAKYGFEYPFHANIKEVDEKMLRIEWNTLMLEKPGGFEVYNSQKAKLFFMKKFEKLKMEN